MQGYHQVAAKGHALLRTILRKGVGRGNERRV